MAGKHTGTGTRGSAEAAGKPNKSRASGIRVSSPSGARSEILYTLLYLIEQPVRREEEAGWCVWLMLAAFTLY